MSGRAIVLHQATAAYFIVFLLILHVTLNSEYRQGEAAEQLEIPAGGNIGLSVGQLVR